ncbi:MAG: NAD-dependent epimerase/dehydratase family protein [Chthoniobacterales bacterium]
MSQRLVVAGCGYVGRATAALFHTAGWEVIGWTSSAESAAQLAAEPYAVCAVDIADAAAVAEAKTAADAVIHCASSGGGGAEEYRRIYLEGARNLAAAFPRSLLVFTSSTSVYAQNSGEWVTEESSAEPARETGRILRAAEELILARGGIVGRLAGIYGPKRSALLRKLLSGEAVIDPGDERFINQVHRDDIAAALFHLIAQARSVAEAQIYNVSDNHPISQRECYQWLAAHLRRPVPPMATGAPARKRGNSNKRVSSTKLQALGWAPRYPTFQIAMTESILPAAGL